MDITSAPPDNISRLLKPNEMQVRSADWHQSDEGKESKREASMRKYSGDSVHFSTSDALKRSDNFWLKKNRRG